MHADVTSLPEEKMRLSVVEEWGHYWIKFGAVPKTPQEIEGLYRSLEGEDLEVLNHVLAGLPCPVKFMEKYRDEFGWTDEMMACAHVFHPERLPESISYFPEPWYCFENCSRESEETGMLYVEGLVVSPTGVQIHAWNSTDGNDVIDRTWPCQHLNGYFGVVFDVALLRETLGAPGGLLERFRLEAIAKRQQTGP